jgi:hypothetical protein
VVRNRRPKRRSFRSSASEVPVASPALPTFLEGAPSMMSGKSFAQLAWLDKRATSGSWWVAKNSPNFPAWICKVVGGTTVHWGGGCLRFQEHEFRAKDVHFDDHANDIAMRDHAYKRGAMCTTPSVRPASFGSHRVRQRITSALVVKARGPRTVFAIGGARLTILGTYSFRMGANSQPHRRQIRR